MMRQGGIKNVRIEGEERQSTVGKGKKGRMRRYLSLKEDALATFAYLGKSQDRKATTCTAGISGTPRDSRNGLGQDVKGLKITANLDCFLLFLHVQSSKSVFLGSFPPRKPTRANLHFQANS